MKTPNTLRQAIQNGIEDGITQLAGTTKPAPKAADVIERHVRRFIKEAYGLELADIHDIESAKSVVKQAIEDKKEKSK